MKFKLGSLYLIETQIGYDIIIKMKYQIIFLACIVMFAATASANPLVEAKHYVSALMDDLLNLIQNPSLPNAMAILANYGWAQLAPYVGGFIRMQAHDDYVKGNAGGKTELAHY